MLRVLKLFKQLSFQLFQLSGFFLVVANDLLKLLSFSADVTPRAVHFILLELGDIFYCLLLLLLNFELAFIVLLD